MLLHPQSKTNASILEKYIATMREKGYEFASIKELSESGKES